MKLFVNLLNCCVAVLLVISSASAVLGAANGQYAPCESPAPSIKTGQEWAINTIGIESDNLTGYFENRKNAFIALPTSDLPGDSANDLIRDKTAITLHKNGDEVIWSCSPSFSRLGLNPIDNLKNLTIMFQYKF